MNPFDVGFLVGWARAGRRVGTPPLRRGCAPVHREQGKLSYLLFTGAGHDTTTRVWAKFARRYSKTADVERVHLFTQMHRATSKLNNIVSA